MSKQTQKKLAAVTSRLLVLVGLVAITALVTNVVVTRAVDEPKHDHDHDHGHKHDHGEKDPMAEMAAWENANKIGPQHDLLKVFAGEWKCENTMYPGPGAPGMKSKAESKSALVYGGRYVRHAYEGKFSMPGPDGKEMTHDFSGYGVLGYDTMRKQYVSIWIDNMSTGIYMETGQYDEAKKQLVLHGDMPTPDGKTAKNKSIYTFSGKDKWSLEMHMEMAPGQSFKHMEIVYTRD